MPKLNYQATNKIDNIGGKIVAVGEVVTLDDSAAAPFVSSGALVETEAKAAPAPKDLPKDPPAK